MANITWNADLIGAFLVIAVLASAILFGWGVLLWFYPGYAALLVVCLGVGFTAVYKLTVWMEGQ